MADDNQQSRVALGYYFTNLGCEVFPTSNFTETLSQFSSKPHSFDFVIVNIAKIESDNFFFVKKIRSLDLETPILVLLSNTSQAEKLVGFVAGIDDYLTKPIEIEELAARMFVIWRRQQIYLRKSQGHLCSELRFDVERCLLYVHNRTIKLTPKSNQLLYLLYSNKNTLVSRKEALEKIWGADTYYNGRSMDVYISKLRKILEVDSSIKIITLHRLGFKLTIN